MTSESRIWKMFPRTSEKGKKLHLRAMREMMAVNESLGKIVEMGLTDVILDPQTIGILQATNRMLHGNIHLLKGSPPS